MKNSAVKKDYAGFELGPIRPPSEAQSLLLRITRNCPWNKCTFCGLYKGEKFSLRPVEHILKDIDTVRQDINDIQQIAEHSGNISQQALFALQKGRTDSELQALYTALSWHQGGMKSIFLQDANTLIVKPDDLVEILNYVRKSLPQVERVTSYARSKTIARISDEDMGRMAKAGLNRIHVGMESASNKVLEFIKKGVDKETHIKAGQRVKRAGIELSEYVMPGLGGETFSRENALETADALNQINPDFIRIRTLGIPESVELHRDLQSGAFTLLGDVPVAEELLLLLEHLDGITSRVKSDHILNLFQEAEGRLPKDKERITAPIKKFLAMEPEQQLIYRIGRRTGIFSRLEDMNNPTLRAHAEKTRTTYGITLDTIDHFTAQMMQNYI